jgi:hypothetical protein
MISCHVSGEKIYCCNHHYVIYVSRIPFRGFHPRLLYAVATRHLSFLYQINFLKKWVTIRASPTAILCCRYATTTRQLLKPPNSSVASRHLEFGPFKDPMPCLVQPVAFGTNYVAKEELDAFVAKTVFL